MSACACPNEYQDEVVMNITKKPKIADEPQAVEPFRNYYRKHFSSRVAQDLAGTLFPTSRTGTKVSSPSEPVNEEDDSNTDGMSKLPLRKDFQEAFDARDVPNELLEAWEIIEKQALKARPGVLNMMPLQVRDTVHRYLQHIIQLVGLPVQKWFEAVTMLDVYHLKNQDGLSLASLAPTCSALVMVLKKNDTATVPVSASQLAPHAAQLAQWLQRLGIPNVSTDVTETVLLEAERHFLQVLEWRINLPTVECWTSTFCVRFNVLTQNLFLASMNWIWQHNLMISRMIMMRQAINSEISPRKISVGLLGLGLVAAQLLPGDALRPSKIPAADWERLYIESQPQSQPQGAMPACVLNGGHAKCLLDILQATVAWSLFEVQEACYLTASVVRDGLADIQGMRQAAEGQAPTVHLTTV